MPTQPAGMMGQMTPEQAPVQPSAEPQAVAPQQGGYNGTVTYEGEQLQVKGGVETLSVMSKMVKFSHLTINTLKFSVKWECLSNGIR